MRKIYEWARSLSYRRATDRWLGGICAGLAQQTGIDVTLIRVVAVLLLFPFSVGSIALLYILAWLILPDREDNIVLEKTFGDPQPSPSHQPHFAYTSAPAAQAPFSAEPASTQANAPGEPGTPAPGTTPAMSATSVTTPTAPAPSFDPTATPSFNPAAVRHTQLPGISAKRPPRQGPGSTLSLLVGGILLIVIAILLLAGFTDYLGKTAASIFCIIAVTIICALGAIAAHLRGRNGTWMTALASICAWGLLFPSILVYGMLPSGIRYSLLNGHAPLYSSATIDSPSPNSDYDFILGEMSLFLPSAEETRPHSTYSVEGGIGEVIVYVPEGVQATINPQVGIGEIQWDDPSTADPQGFWNTDSCDAVFGFSSTPCSEYERGGITVGSGVPVTVDVDLSLGSLEIVALHE